MRHRFAACGAAALALATLIVAVPGTALAGAPKEVDPKYNRPLSFYAPCETSPMSVACSAKLLGALNSAREATNGTSYALPAKFLDLAPQEQLLVLTNSDRAHYGLPAVLALNSTLNTAAQGGVRAGEDPTKVVRIGGAGWREYSANYAAGDGEYENALAAYYGWMYDDGRNKDGSPPPNLDCVANKPSTCWGHRHDVLGTSFAGTQRFMGVATGPQPHVSSGRAWATIWENFDTPRTGAAIPTIPTITGLSPASGPHNVTTTITVDGYGFYGVKAAYVWSASTSFKVLSGTRMTVTAPKRSKAGTGGRVAVRTSGGTSPATSATLYSYT